jgi:hypothetical protein
MQSSMKKKLDPNKTLTTSNSRGKSNTNKKRVRIYEGKQVVDTSDNSDR